jgi:hypothetical protein
MKIIAALGAKDFDRFGGLFVINFYVLFILKGYGYEF